MTPRDPGQATAKFLRATQFQYLGSVKPPRTTILLGSLVCLLGTWTCNSDTVLVIETTHVAKIEDTSMGSGFPTQDAVTPPWADGTLGGLILVKLHLFIREI